MFSPKCMLCYYLTLQWILKLCKIVIKCLKGPVLMRFFVRVH